MVYSERRQTREYTGYARFSVAPSLKEQLAALLREGDRVYDDGTTVRVIAPVPDEKAAECLANRVEKALDAQPQHFKFIPKENALIAGPLEIDKITKEAYLHSHKPLSQAEIAETLTTTFREHPEAIASIEAVYVQSNEPVSYFTARRFNDTLVLGARTADRDLKAIPVRAVVSSGFVVCPLSSDSETRYHSVTKTLTINKGKQ